MDLNEMIRQIAASDGETPKDRPQLSDAEKVAGLEAFYDDFIVREETTFKEGDLLVFTGKASWLAMPGGEAAMFGEYLQRHIYGYEAADCAHTMGSTAAAIRYDCIVYFNDGGDVLPLLCDTRHLRRPTEAEIASYRATAD